MATLSPHQATQHFVSLSKFDTSIDRVLSTMWEALGSSSQSRLFPTMIGLDIDYNGYANAVPTIRSFLKKFRSITQRHFVRFVTDTLWAMESDNGDVFYTHDGRKESQCDVVWQIKLLSAKQIEITAFNKINLRQYDYFTTFSQGLKRFLMSSNNRRSKTDLDRLIKGFYKNTPCIDTLHRLERNIRILLIPNAADTGFYPVVIPTMSHFDGVRKGRQIEREFEYHLKTRYEILTQNANPCDVLYRLIELIQGNDKFGVNLKLIQDTYALAESLLGTYSGMTEAEPGRHEIILFKFISDTDMDTHHYSLDYLAKVL